LFAAVDIIVAVLGQLFMDLVDSGVIEFPNGSELGPVFMVPDTYID